MLRAIVFDFDGVIANSEPLHLRAFQDVLAAERIELSERDYFARYLGYDDLGAFRAIGAAYGRRWTPSDLDRLVSEKAIRMEALEAQVSVLFPGAADAIRRAAAEVPIAIASGALGHEIRRVLDREQLTRYFTCVISAEDTAASKPAPDPYLAAVRDLSKVVGPELSASGCAAIEDSRWGLESARAAGLRTVAVAHTYDKAALAHADLILDRIADLNVAALARLWSR